METGPAGKMSLRELVDIHGSRLPGLRTMSKKSGKADERPVWISKELLSLLRHEQETR